MSEIILIYRLQQTDFYVQKKISVTLNEVLISLKKILVVHKNRECREI